MTAHTLRALPETTRIGVFDATFPPVLTIESGDRWWSSASPAAPR